MLSSCSQRAFSDDKFIFSDKYLSLIKPYKVGDTLKFENSTHQTETFAITKSDSTIFNSKGWFMNTRPYKYISISYNQLPTKQWTHENTERDANNNAIKTTKEDDVLMSLNIYPDNGEQSCYFSFKNFRGWIEQGKDSVYSQPIIANGQKIDNYYRLDNEALDLVKSATDVKIVYINNDKGIVAYQDQNNNWWTRIY